MKIKWNDVPKGGAVLDRHKRETLQIWYVFLKDGDGNIMFLRNVPEGEIDRLIYTLPMLEDDE